MSCICRVNHLVAIGVHRDLQFRNTRASNYGGSRRASPEINYHTSELPKLALPSLGQTSVNPSISWWGRQWTGVDCAGMSRAGDISRSRIAKPHPGGGLESTTLVTPPVVERWMVDGKAQRRSHKSRGHPLRPRNPCLLTPSEELIVREPAASHDAESHSLIKHWPYSLDALSSGKEF